jgi:predicted DNA-binding ribbon-helix-helix protein
MKKRSVTLRGHPTSITLEDEFWVILKQIAERRGQSIASLIDGIDEKRLEVETGGLSSAIRVFILNYLTNQLG